MTPEENKVFMGLFEKARADAHPVLLDLFNRMRELDKGTPLTPDASFTIICFDDDGENMTVMGSSIHPGFGMNNCPPLEILCDWPLSASAANIGASLFIHEYVEHIEELYRLRHRIRAIGGRAVAEEFMANSTCMDDFKRQLAKAEKDLQDKKALEEIDPTILFKA
jgi:hypothetical protein